jgi:hypothetical protein
MLAQQLRHMNGFTLRTIVNLMATARAIGYHNGVSLGTHRRQQTELSHLHRHLEV